MTSLRKCEQLKNRHTKHDLFARDTSLMPSSSHPSSFCILQSPFALSLALSWLLRSSLTPFPPPYPSWKVFVTEFDAGRLSVFALDGTFKRCFGSEGHERGQFFGPAGLCFTTVTGPKPELFVCDTLNHRIQVIDPEKGRVLRMWGSQGSNDGQLCSPRDVKVSEVGEVFVADRDNHRICVFRPDGMFLRSLGKGKGAGDGQLNEPHGICLTHFGTLLVCDNRNNRIQELACADGVCVGKWGKGGQGKGEFEAPRGVVMEEGGQVYVCDKGNRVQVFV